MKKNLFKIVFLIFLLFISASFVACGGSGNDTDDDTVVLTWYKTTDSEPYVMNIIGGSFSLPESDMNRPGYKFLGLYDAPSGGTQVVNEYGISNVNISKSMTLYAQWEVKQYKIVFEAEELEQSDKLSVHYYEATLSIFPVPEKEGYTFLGWSNGEGTMYTDGYGFVKSDYNTLTNAYYKWDENDIIHLYPEYEIKKLNVIFDYNDGSYTSETITVQYGETLNPEIFPQSDTGSKKIIGWSLYRNELVEFTGTVGTNLTLYAIWVEYKTFDLVTDENAEPEKFTVNKNQELDIPIPQKNGYVFEGWYSNNLYSGLPVTKINYGSAYNTYYAKWALANYTITFDVNGGDAVLDNMKYTILDSVLLPNPGNKEHFEFVGWCMKQDLTDTPVDSIEIGTYGDLVLYAKWKGINRTVNLDPVDGMIAVESQIVEYGAKFNLGVPSLLGYEFVGWYLGDQKLTDKTGKSYGTWDYLDEVTTVKAKYLQKHYVEINYSHFNAGTIELKEYYVIGDEVKLELVVTDNGYVAKGFYINGVLVSETLEYSFIMPDEDVKVDVKFDERIFNITFNTDGGVMKTEINSVGYLSEYDFPAPYKEGFLFNGWKYGELVITDNTGKGITKWNIKEDAELIATYVEDPNASNVVVITTAEELRKISEDATKIYHLINDIDMSGTPWIPFEFSGQLYGNGYSIKNLTISSASGNVGMFTKLTGKIVDLTLENISVSSTSEDESARAKIGAVCGELTGTITGVIVQSGEIYGNVAMAGGLVGYGASGLISNSVNKAVVRTQKAKSHTGGIIGVTEGVKVEGSINYGTIQGISEVGGIAGYVGGTPNLVNNINYGVVKGTTNVGGVIGCVESDGTYSINELENNGKVTGTTNVGGVIGKLDNYVSNYYNSYSFTSTKFYNNGDVTGETYVGGIFGYLKTNNADRYATTITATEYHNTGSITGITYIGGLVGYGYSDSGSSSISKSSSSGTISAECRVGGLAGWLDNINIADSSNLGTKIIASGYFTQDAVKYAYVGGYAGKGHSISGCTNISDIAYNKEGRFVGGIAGYLSGTINSSTNKGVINATGSDYVGGLVGELYLGGTYTISNLTNTGNVTANNYVGGIFGWLDNYVSDYYNNYTLTSNKLINSGNITGVNYVGGLYGYLVLNNADRYAVTITATEYSNTGNITGTAYVGGLIGFGSSDSGSSTISGSSSCGIITAETRIGGLAGWLNNINLNNCSNEGTEIVATGYYTENAVKYAYVGGYVGRGNYVSGCVNNSNITYTAGGRFVGGIAGYASVINSSINNGTITAIDSEYVGGLVGKADGDGTYTSSNLTNTGDVTGNNYVGGVFGILDNYVSDYYNNYTLTSNKLSNSGNITGVNYVGGLYGYLVLNNGDRNAVILTATEYSNSGNITGTAYVGGLIGLGSTDSGSSTISGSSSSGIITAETRIGGLAGWLIYINLNNCSNEGTEIVATGYYTENAVKYAYIGGYVGRGHAVTGCINNSDITYTAEGRYVGGIAGYLIGSINSSTNNATITAIGSDHVGGLVGFCDADGTYTISNLTNTGDVTGKDRVGGIFGWLDNYVSDYYNNYTLTSNKLTNSGNITGVNYVGGLYGYLVLNNGDRNAVILTATEYTNTGNITGLSHVGGLIGLGWTDSGSSTISGSSSSGIMTSETRIGGLAGWLHYINLNNCSNEGTEIVATGYYTENAVKYAYIGGYVGRGHAVTGCINNSNITYTAEGRFVGGIAGYLLGSINSSTNNGTITAIGSDYVGGLVGLYDADGTFTTSNLTNTGNVTGTNYVGGIFGEFNNVVSDYYNHYCVTSNKVSNSGNITGVSYIGGICGNFYLNNNDRHTVYLTATEYANTGEITGETAVGGFIGRFYSDGGSKIVSYVIEGNMVETLVSENTNLSITNS